MHQPYSIDFDEDGLAVFETDTKASYKALFVELPNIQEPDLEGLIFDFSFRRDASKCDRPGRPGIDPRVKPTIGKLVNRFFELAPNSVLYFVCESNDRKHRGRWSIFDGWFASHSTTFIKLPFHIPGSIMDNDEHANDLLGGAFFLSNHSLRSQIEAFVKSEIFVYTAVKAG